MSLRFQPAAGLELGRLADLFNAAYEGYLVPFSIDERTLRFMVDAYDLNLEASRIALLDSVPVGLATLAVRGERAWIGGIGVTPFGRRRGIGEQLMRRVIEQARERGVRFVQLEVIEANAPAIALYEKVGFEDVRHVDVLILDADPGARGDAPGTDVDAAHDLVRVLRHAGEPWQRDDETLARLRSLEPPLRALGGDGGAAIVRPTPAAASVVQIAGDEATARAVLATLRREGSVNVLNLPDDEPAAEAFRAVGARIAVRQREMALSL
ncbi:MAG TPA: GNAT family N-acetyltransferase [Gaiellaceae bacterium]|nr:GNAT family N-acetyltransferase [Gaiellaceae bacterium]